MIPVPPPPKPVPPPPKPASGVFVVLLLVGALVWVSVSRWIASSSATGIADRLNLPSVEPFGEALFWVFLLVVGFSMLQFLRRQRSSLRDLLGLPSRSTAAREWSTGATIGWASALSVVLVLALFGALRVQLSGSGHDLLLTLLSVVALALLSFAEETAFRGYPFRLLREVLGPSSTAVVLSVVFGLFSVAHPFSTPVSVFVTMLLGLVLSIGWLRTHGLWISWGLNFGFKTAAGVLFGLPVNGSTSYSYAVQSSTVGRMNWTGGSYGLPGSLLSGMALLIAIPVVVRLTRDYAWNYTHRTIHPGGYAVEVAPPAAHVAMEQKAAPAGTTLVQILPAEASSFSSQGGAPVAGNDDAG